jgi:hypothetical protein
MAVVLAARLSTAGVRWFRVRSLKEPGWWPEFEQDFWAYVQEGGQKVHRPQAEERRNPPRR